MWASYPRFFLWHMQCGNWSLWFHEVTPFTFESLAQSHESLEWNPRVLRPWPLKWQWWNERLPNIWSWPRLRAESERASSRPFSQRWIHWNATGYHWAPGLKVELVNLKHPHPIGPDTGRSGGCVKTENTFKPGCGSSNSKVMNIEGLISIIIDIYWYLLYIYGYWIKLSDYPTPKICHSLVHPSCHLPLHQGFQGARHRYVDDMVPYWNLDRAVSPLETSGWGDIQSWQWPFSTIARKATWKTWAFFLGPILESIFSPHLYCSWKFSKPSWKHWPRDLSHYPWEAGREAR